MYQDLTFQIDMGSRAVVTGIAAQKIGKEIERLLGSKIETFSNGFMHVQAQYKIINTALTKVEIKEILQSAYVNSKWKVRVQ